MPMVLVVFHSSLSILSMGGGEVVDLMALKACLIRGSSDESSS